MCLYFAECNLPSFGTDAAEGGAFSVRMSNNTIKLANRLMAGTFKEITFASVIYEPDSFKEK